MKTQEQKVPQEMSDAELMSRVQAGDDELFRTVSDRYRMKLLRYVLKYVHTQDAAEDVLQNVFMKAHKNIATFDTARAFSPWIYRIAHNEAVTYITRKQKKQTISLDQEMGLSPQDHLALADIELASMEGWFQQELREEMAEAIAQLPDKYADIIHMRFLEGLSYQEMSDKLGKPVNTVGTLVRRAKKRLLEIVLTMDDDS